MEDIMEDNFEKLNLLLEQELCEFVDIPDGFTGQTESGELRLIYLMNDAVESFLVLKNARMTGNYVRDYEGEFEGSLEKADRDLCEAEYILVVHQGRNVFTVFFEDILLETHLYNYGELGHFWVKGYENLRVMEYQIAILRDKYEYLGEEYCTEQERKLAMLRDFPPLNYLFYPAVPEKYIVPVDNPWEVTAEALAVMQELAEEAGDEKLEKMLRRYGKNPDISNARKILCWEKKSGKQLQSTRTEISGKKRISISVNCWQRQKEKEVNCIKRMCRPLYTEKNLSFMTVIPYRFRYIL